MLTKPSFLGILYSIYLPEKLHDYFLIYPTLQLLFYKLAWLYL
jgi:hypothetical protein